MNFFLTFSVLENYYDYCFYMHLNPHYKKSGLVLAENAAFDSAREQLFHFCASKDFQPE